MTPLLRRQGCARRIFALATLTFGIGALVATPGATAGPAVSTTSPFTYTGTNTCIAPPEAFTGTGTLHTSTTENLSASGVLQSHFNARIDGLQAVAVLTGKKYVVQDTLNHEFVFGSATEDTFDMTAHFIRVGEDGTLIFGDDFYEYLRAHITVNANGMMTSFYVNMNAMPCQ